MNKQFSNLFSPIKVRNYTYKNRIINAPTLFAHSVLFLPEIKENVYRMVENRAKGGSAAVSTGEISVNAEEALCLFLERPVDFSKYEGEDFEAIKEFATRIKKHGAIAYLEFCHEGARSEAKPPYQPWGPDGYIREDGVEVKAMDLSMMEKVCEDFARISRFAKACGFDGVLVHGGHGFNMQQFLSSWTNHRRDEFGGSMENRARFPMMILDAVREAIGEEMIIELRISAEDGVEGGLTIDDTVEFCKLIDGKVDIIHVSNGLKWAGNQTNTFSDFFKVHGINVEHAAKIKKVVKKSLVAVIGGINSPEQAEEIIASGKADFIELGRQGFADPEFANKAKNGEADKIRRCVRCFQCYPGFCEHKTDIPLWEKLSKEEAAKIYSPASMGRCAINPNSGFGHYPDRMQVPKKSREVLVIGGGAGGLQAALTAKERGHKVTLAEKSNRLGGIINFTDIDEDKVDLRNFKNLLIREVENDKDINVMMNTEADEKLINEINPDTVIIAVGSHPLVPKIPGIDTAMNALEAYNSMDKIGKKVVLVGGGLVGCEVGLHLASKGKEVTVVEMNTMMAFETFGYYRNALLDEMDKRSIKQLLGAKCLEFKKDGVLVSKDGQESSIQADTVIYSMGMKANTKDVEKLKDICKDKEVHVIGDCLKPGKVGDSVRSGYMAAMSII
ncbi:FAD-dependent oxidoreductase [Clostridium thailandense]|uniref:oxidoreductase n=1 Tax=Clostridium thailandense TaxID=2794346 RepID=UPI003988F5FE